jgi:GNAT superfamily N-acetyltransferase
MLTLQIRPMTRAELDLGLDWAAQEGWNPGLHDADSFHATDPQGFLLGTLGGEPVGMVSAVRYGTRFGFLGFYIVRPAYRRQGYGLALWRAAMQRLEGRVIGLDGVVAQQDNYRQSGFELAWNNVRYQGAAQARKPAAPSVVGLQALPLRSVLEYDAAFFPDDRRRFTRHWVTQHGSTAMAVRRGGRLVGYGVIRPCRAGHKIGPLFADDFEAAEDLFSALLLQVPQGAMVQIDVPATNSQALALVRAQDLAPVFETARMYVGSVPSLPMARLFGVTTFELG